MFPAHQKCTADVDALVYLGLSVPPQPLAFCYVSKNYLSCSLHCEDKLNMKDAIQCISFVTVQIHIPPLFSSLMTTHVTRRKKECALEMDIFHDAH